MLKSMKAVPSAGGAIPEQPMSSDRDGYAATRGTHRTERHAAKLGRAPFTASCGSATCPQVYRTDEDTFVVQGALLDAQALGVPTADGEALVEIPGEVFRSALAAAREEHV